MDPPFSKVKTGSCIKFINADFKVGSRVTNSPSLSVTEGSPGM